MKDENMEIVNNRNYVLQSPPARPLRTSDVALVVIMLAIVGVVVGLVYTGMNTPPLPSENTYGERNAAANETIAAANATHNAILGATETAVPTFTRVATRIATPATPIVSYPVCDDILATYVASPVATPIAVPCMPLRTKVVTPTVIPVCVPSSYGSFPQPCLLDPSHTMGTPTSERYKPTGGSR